MYMYQLNKILPMSAANPCTGFCAKYTPPPHPTPRLYTLLNSDNPQMTSPLTRWRRLDFAITCISHRPQPEYTWDYTHVVFNGLNRNQLHVAVRIITGAQLSWSIEWQLLASQFLYECHPLIHHQLRSQKGINAYNWAMVSWEPEGHYCYTKSMHGDSTILVLKGTSLNAINALLALSWRILCINCPASQ